MSLESRLTIPFELGTYYFDLDWKCLTIGTAELSFCRIKPENLPEQAKKVYESGDLYKVVFEGRLAHPLFKLIAEKGVFTSYICIKDMDAHPLIATAETRILWRNAFDTVVYDRKNNILSINGTAQKLSVETMRLLKDPVSHVIHLLFSPRTSEGSSLCGYYHNMQGRVEPLLFEYSYEGGSLVGAAVIKAGTYFVDTDLTLELPYSYNAWTGFFVPSLKERVAVRHKYLKEVVLNFKRFEAPNL